VLLVVHIASLLLADSLYRGSIGMFEVLSHYKPGKTYHWHHATAIRARGRTWTIKLPHDPRIFGTVDPKIVEHVLVTKFTNYDKGPQWRNAFQDFLGDGIFNADGATWRQQRKLASHEFSVRTLRVFMTEVFRERAAALLPIVQASCEAGTPLEVQDIFARYTLDSIGHIGFGVEICSLENGAVASAFARGFDQCTTNIGNRFIDPLWKLKRMFNVGFERKLRSALQDVVAFSDKVIQERHAVSEDDLSGRSDILSRFMLKGFSDTQLRDVVINFVLAGRDTTAILLTWTMFELAQHPEVVTRLRAEAAAVRGSPAGEGGLGGGDSPAFEEINKMPYLKATLTEVLRLHPSVPLDFKQATNDDTLPDGTVVRRNQRIMFVTWSMGRLASLWPDPTRFDPTRFLDESGAFKFPSASVFPVFLAGPRTCLGKEMAYLGSGLLLTTLLSRYDVALADPAESITYDVGLTLWTENGVRMRFTERGA